MASLHPFAEPRRQGGQLLDEGHEDEHLDHLEEDCLAGGDGVVGVVGGQLLYLLDDPLGIVQQHTTELKQILNKWK